MFSGCLTWRVSAEKHHEHSLAPASQSMPDDGETVLALFSCFEPLPDFSALRFTEPLGSKVSETTECKVSHLMQVWSCGVGYAKCKSKEIRFSPLPPGLSALGFLLAQVFSFSTI